MLDAAAACLLADGISNTILRTRQRPATEYRKRISANMGARHSNSSVGERALLPARW